MPNVHDFSATSLDGKPKSLAEYKGRVLLIVNTASECGLTPQYAGLETMHRELASRGLAILGFPANQFGAQEPGTNAEIATFCQKNYGVTFDMFEKVVVKGPGIHPLFDYLTKQTGGDIKWNFGKFLIGKNGEIVKRFEPNVEPASPELRAAIDQALAT